MDPQVTVNFTCQRCGQPIHLDQGFSHLSELTLAELAYFLKIDLITVLKKNAEGRRDVIIAPACISGESDEALPEEMKILVDLCRQFSTDLVVGCDANTHHILLGSSNIKRVPIHSEQDLFFSEAYKLDKIISPMKQNEVSGQSHGFTFVGDTLESQKPSPFKAKNKLFDMLSSKSDIDHPLCEECTDALAEKVDCIISRYSLQVQHYDKLYTSKKDVKDDTSELEEELALLQKEQNRLLDELSEVKREQIEAEQILIKRKEEKKRLEEEEINYWKQFCLYKSQLIGLEDENRSLKSRRTYMQDQLDQLEKLNALNATFRIWFNSYIGTINGLHLGRLPTIPVSWPEINAAWGQTVLLVSALARKANFTFSKYKLVPHGNMSYVETLGDKKEQLPLYGSGGIRFLWDSKFDTAMAAFIKCVEEFQHYIESNKFQDSKDVRNKFCLPYRISDHYLENSKAKGESYSIKMQFNSEECWTKSLKFMLINLKWAITWVSTTTDSPFSPAAAATPSVGS